MALDQLESAFLACLLMLSHAFSCSLAYVCYLLFFVTIEGLIMLDKHVQGQNRELGVKPVKISGFSACSCLLMLAHVCSLFFVTI